MTIVAADLTALKAADVTNISMIYDTAIFTWIAGDFTGRADDTTIIESSVEPLSNGAWVRQSDESLTFQAGDAGATRTARDKARERISLLDYLGTGTGTFAEALQAATDRASLVNGEVDLGSGEYILNPTCDALSYHDGPAFGTTLKYAIRLKSNVRYVGRGATIKVADHVSSRENPQNFAVFFSDESLENIQFQGITIDLNAS